MTLSAAQETRVDLPKQVREAPISSVDREARTVEVVWTTGATVRRRTWRDYERITYDEILVVTPDAIDLTRLSEGGPVLDSHSTWSTDDQLAVVDRAWVEGGKGVALVRFPSAGVDPEADKLFGKVAEGIVRNLSVGYSIDKVEVTKADRAGGVEQWRVTRWTPFEISFVTVPADAGAQTRGAGTEGAPRLFPAIVTRSGSDHQENIIMDEETRSEPGTDAARETTTTTTIETRSTVDEARAAELAAAAVRAERTRTSEIMTIGRRHSVSDEIIERAIAEDTTVAVFKDRVLDHLAETGSPSRSVRIAVTHPGESPDQRIAAMADGIVLRGAGQLRAVGDENDQAVRERTTRAREFASMGLLDLGAELCGIRGRMTRAATYEAIVRAAQHGTTDFPNLLAAAANKFLLQRYQYQEATYRRFARKRNFNDFKVHNFLRLGDFPLLEGLTETGEFKYGTLSESKETVAAGTYGKIISITRQMFVNDDLGAFADLTGMAGQRVMDFENRLAWSIIMSNAGVGPTMSDGLPLFHAAKHGNTTATGAGIDINSVDVARIALRNQKSLDGVPLNAVPVTLVVGPAKQLQAEQLLSTNLLATQLANINIFATKLDLVVDAYITDASWYVFADVGSVPVFTWGYVDGFEGPRFALDQPFKQDGLALKVVEDFGFGAIDYRGAFRTPAAA